MGGWRKRDLFSHDLVLAGLASLPHSLSLPQTDCVCDWAGSSCLSWAFWHSSLSCPPIPLPPAVSCPLRVSIFADAHSPALTLFFAYSIYRHRVMYVSTLASLLLPMLPRFIFLSVLNNDLSLTNLVRCSEDVMIFCTVIYDENGFENQICTV